MSISKKVFVFLSLTYFVIEFYIWYATNGIPGMKDQTEPFMAYLAGLNFARFGLFNLSFVADYASGSDPAAHPYYYTHNPAFPMYICYVLIKTGITDIRFHNLIGVFFQFAGLMFSYLYIRSKLNNRLALCLLGLSVFNYLGVVIYGNNIFRSISWFCVWGTLYFAHLWQIQKKPVNLYFVLAVIFLFLTVYFEISIAVFVVSYLLFDKFLDWQKYRLKPLLFMLFLGTFLPLLIHTINVANAIGLDTLIKDFTYTLGNRTIGIPSRPEMEKFYAENGIVLWGYTMDFNYSFIIYSIKLAITRISQSLGTGTFWLVSGCFSFALTTIILRCLRIIRIKETLNTELKVILALILALICTACILPAQFVFVHVGPFAPLIIFAFGVPQAFLLSKLIELTLSRAGKWAEIRNKKWAFVLVGYLFYFIFIQMQGLKAEPIETLPARHVLEKEEYKGRSFITNFLYAYPGYFTGEWANTKWTSYDPSNIGSVNYLWERDKFVNREKYEKPDFALCMDTYNDMTRNISGDMFSTYRIVEEGKSFYIFDLREPLRTTLRSF